MEDTPLTEEQLIAKVAALEELLHNTNEALEDARLMLTVSNERWVAQVNENTRLEVQLRKIK